MSKDIVEKLQQNKQFTTLLLQTIYNEESLLTATGIQILIIIVKNSNGKKENFDLTLNINFFFELFDKNINTNPITSVLVANLVAELLQIDSFMTKTLLFRSLNLKFFENLNEILGKFKLKLIKIKFFSFIK